MPTRPSPATGDLLLKVTPPRVPREALVRAGLALGARGLGDPPLLLVQAPAGFGKTLLLAQWRREHLARGAAVAWLLAQPHDEPARFLQALALAVGVATGRPRSGHALVQGAGALEGMTSWLAEVAQGARELVLVVDEADRLPPATRDALAYLLRNAPPNLHCLVAARVDCQFGLEDLVAYGHCVTVGLAQLRFTPEETFQLLRNRFGEPADRDAAARLHALAEGWPLGLQLALSVDAAGGAPAEAPLPPLYGAALRARLLEFLLGKLAPADLDFLTRIAVADVLHPDLCAALVPEGEPRERLARLLRETPLFVASEAPDWLRLHSVAAEALRQRSTALPPQEQHALHARAAEWMAAHGLLDAAARHAWAAQQPQQAYALAEASLYEAMTHGGHAQVQEWLARLPAEELEQRPRLLLAAAWSLAVSERHAEVQQLVRRLLATPQADDALRCECALILGAAALFADDPDRFAQLHAPWADTPPLGGPVLLQIHANRTAFRTLLEGEPALARLRHQHAPGGGAAPAHVTQWGDFTLALSFLWEGQVAMVEQLVRPALERAEADLGRRSVFASMLAALLAAALWERDQPGEASALLADRLDVLERSALPEGVLLAFRTLARIAVASGNEARALQLLGALDAVGIARGLPRLRLASLCEQVRLHSREFRGASCSGLLRQVDALLERPDTPRGPLWLRSVAGPRLLAQAYAAIAAHDWRGALAPLAECEALALRLRQGRERIEALALRGWVLDRCGEQGLPLLREAVGLAQGCGLVRVVADAHPGLAELLRGALSPAAAAPAGTDGGDAARSPFRARTSTSLTPKEREVLQLLARSLSNKEIGLALQVSEETIKWHMKNLLAKLDASSRKQVVSRARLLGLLADAAGA